MHYQDVEATPAYQMWLATNAWQRAVRKALEPFDLTHVQYVILACINLLTKDGKGPTQVEVSRFAALDVNMTSQVLRSLESRGLIVRSQDPHDRRAHLLSLTQKGTVLQDSARRIVKPTSTDFFARLGDEAAQLTMLLRKLNQP